MVYLRMPLSPYLWQYIKRLLPSSPDPSVCKSFVEEALKYTCHVARVRSVAYAAGFCAYYARMVEKMGVFETVSESIPGKGRNLHILLAFTSQDLFSKHTLDNILRDLNRQASNSIISDSINNALESLRWDDDGELRSRASTMMRKLISALSRAREIMGLGSNANAKLFPIVEQEFIDFDDHMYGAPDLILEDPDSGKAVVVEWKTYGVEEGGWSNVDIAQVIAYAIMEARRLGLKGLKDVFKAISGVDMGIALEVAKHADRRPASGQIKVLDSDLVRRALSRDSIRRELKVLPLIVSKSNSFPPHPYMYASFDTNATLNRFAKLLRVFRGVVVAAEHLTLQLTNVEGLLAEVRGLDLKDVGGQLDRYCRSTMGLAFNYTPRGILPCGVPRDQRGWPCVTKNGKPFCQFSGRDNACMFYFGLRDRMDFENIMWRLRYVVFERRERSLMNYKAIDMLFRTTGLRQSLLQDIQRTCKGFVVDLAGVSARMELHDSAVFYVKVSRGGKMLGKLRFDIVDIGNVDVGNEESTLVVRRKLREVEVRRGVVGTVKRSVVASILESRVRTPLLSINTFLVVGDCDIEGDEVVYYLYSPSPVLYYNLSLFKRYIEIMRDMDPQAKLLLFEAPVNLTIMELRAIDALHRYIATESEKDKGLASEAGVPEDELSKEAEIVKKVVEGSKGEKDRLEGSTPVHEIFRRVFGGSKRGQK
jgi:hypothetical protein